MEENEVVIRVRELSKEYRLGTIGRSTLQHELQSWWDKKRGQPDPNVRVGQNRKDPGETFLALQDISFDVYRGERIGVIGANGAGKSTLFKLLARVTAPTQGAIGLKGRVSSMLEIFRDEIQHHSLLALLDAFEEEGIDCLPLKGIWMKQFYPDPSLRMMADLDILYRPEQLKKVESVLFCGGITSTRRSIPSAKSR